MWPISIPSDVGASHEAILALARKALTLGLTANIRVVLARNPRDPDAEWRPAYGRLDLSRSNDPPSVDCLPRGPVRVLDERVSGDEFVRRLERAMFGNPFEVCGEEILAHGMDSVWAGYHRTSGWTDEGTSWPCAVLAPTTEIPRRPHIYEVIEDAGPTGAFDGLESLVLYVSGMRARQLPDNRLSRFRLTIWDYRGRIDAFSMEGNQLSLQVSPKNDASLRLVGLVSGERTRKPIAIVGPSSVTVSLDEPMWRATVALKSGDDTVAEGKRNLIEEAQVAMLEGRLPPADHQAPPALDLGEIIFDALERALRPAFRIAPKNEKEVQDQIETILHALGVVFHREKERAALGATSFIPDFTVPEAALAIEVKFAKKGRKEGVIQRELAEDAAGYGMKWQQAIAVIYDCGGVIRDPDLMRSACAQLGIRLLVVKH